MVRRSPAVLSDSCPKRHKALKLETWKLHWHLFSHCGRLRARRKLCAFQRCGPEVLFWEVSRGQSTGFRLGKNFAADHICCVNVALRVANGYVLNDRTSAAVGRIRPHGGPFLGEYGVHLTDDFAIIITDQHLVLLCFEISALRSRRRTVPYPTPSFLAICRRLAPS